jgi:hypothetical protein
VLFGHRARGWEEVLMAGHVFRPGEEVIWLKSAGGFVSPVLATVVAVTPKRVTITADDPDERGEGLVTRHVRPISLQPKRESAARRRPARGSRPGKGAAPLSDSFEARYPHIASWVRDGWIEIGRDDFGRPFLRALDVGGVVWEGDERYPSMDHALRALDNGIAEWLEESD